MRSTGGRQQGTFWRSKSATIDFGKEAEDDEFPTVIIPMTYPLFARVYRRDKDGQMQCYRSLVVGWSAVEDAPSMGGLPVLAMPQSPDDIVVIECQMGDKLRFMIVDLDMAGDYENEVELEKAVRAELMKRAD